MRNSIMMALFAFTVAGLVMFASPSMAVHKGVGDLTCGTCHTMHSSQGNSSGAGFAMGSTTGAFILLRANVTKRADIHLFCLQCHAQRGAQGGNTHSPLDITPPKVLTTFGFSGAGFDGIGAGGDFGGSEVVDGGGGMGSTFFSGVYVAGSDDQTVAGDNALGRGHSLGMIGAEATPPGNSAAGVTGVGVALGAGNDLSCTTCHDPHGTDSSTATINQFRNLKMGTSNFGQNAWTNSYEFGDLAASYAGGVSGCKPCATDTTMGTAGTAEENVWPVYLDAANENVYLQAAASPDSVSASADATNYVGISLFCAQCHGAWHEEIRIENDNSNGGTPTDDWRRHPVNNILNDTADTPNSGAGVKIFAPTHFVNDLVIPDTSRLPTSNAAGNTYTSHDATDVDADRVFCLSCHFVHGSPYNDILRWDYTSSVSTGDQAGNGVPTNVGCQQCHNR